MSGFIAEYNNKTMRREDNNKRGSPRYCHSHNGPSWEIDGGSRAIWSTVSTYCGTASRVPDLKGSTSSMVSTFCRQVGFLCICGPFYVSRIVEMRDGWHMLRMDDVLFS